MPLRILFFCVLSVLLTQSAFASDVTDNRATFHVFPQFADGRLADGSYYRSTILIATDMSPANCNIQLLGMTYPGFGPNGSGGGLSITASSGFFFKTDGTQPIRSGAVALLCDQSVAAHVLFGYYSSIGTLISEATVFSSPPSTTSQFWIDGDGGSRLGIALANGSTVAKTYVVAAFDGSAPLKEVVRATVQVGAASQIARFVQDLVPLPANFLGFIRVYSLGSDSQDVYAIGLKFTGVAFTTIPGLARTVKPAEGTTTPPPTSPPNCGIIRC